MSKAQESRVRSGSIFLQRSQNDAHVPLLTLRTVQIMLFNILPDKVWHQVANALAPSEGSPDLCGGDVIGDPFIYQVNVVPVFPQCVRLIDEFLSIVPSPSNTYEPIVFYNSCDILAFPQIGNAEGLQ